MRRARIEVDGQAVEGTVEGDVITLPDARTVATAGAVWLPAVPAPSKIVATHLSYRSRMEEYADGAPARGARLLPQAAVVGERAPGARWHARAAAAT